MMLRNIHFSDSTFVEHSNSDCLQHNNLHAIIGITDAEPCKEWCAQNDQCGAVAVGFESCFLKGLQCIQDLISNSAVVVYLKETA